MAPRRHTRGSTRRRRSARADGATDSDNAPDADDAGTSRGARSTRRTNARGGGRCEVILHVDAEHAVLETGQRVSAETSRRLMCDAARVVMSHASDGSVLDVGRRTRTVPPAIRRALEHRDRGCRFPGCGVRYCDAHHIRHWSHGGATRMDNLLLLCRRHHRLLHEGGCRVAITQDRRLRFIDRHHRVIPEVPALPDLALDIETLNAAAHVSADRDAISGNWSGQYLDVDFALRTLRTDDRDR
ncbi:MAG TPA: HNH endonuclease [Longimicrobiales bacterium]|nr:HNH endonuclease [Longimicrobiales bacterium]